MFFVGNRCNGFFLLGLFPHDVSETFASLIRKASIQFSHMNDVNAKAQPHIHLPISFYVAI